MNHEKKMDAKCPECWAGFIMGFFGGFFVGLTVIIITFGLY